MQVVLVNRHIFLQQDVLPLACLSNMRFPIVSLTIQSIQYHADLTCLTMVVIYRPVADL